MFLSHALKVSTAEQMREFDRRAVEEFGVPSIVLMENAGRHVFDAVRDLLGSVEGRRITVVAGRGNNGGDGFVAARHLRDAGADVKVFLVGGPAGVKGDAKVNLDILLKTGLEVKPVSTLSDIGSELAHSHVIVDAIFGTGLKGDVTGLAADIISAMNSAKSPIVAVDIPSGLDADTGSVLGVCIDATSTVTFALPKIGLLTYPGAAHVGRLIVGEIGIPHQLYDEINIQLTSPEWVAARLPKRPLNAYKGTFGTLVVIAGSNGYTGAAAMSSEAAVRTGAGLCTLGIPKSLQNLMASKLTEVMTKALPETESGTVSVDAVVPALKLCETATAVLLGCGLGHNPQTCEFVSQFVKSIAKPMVLDADGLNALAMNPSIWEDLHGDLVITPHPGEMSRLLGTTKAQIESNRLDAVREAATRFDCVAVLKGARTLIADPSGRVFINTTGNPGLATGGTGDVLAGIIASLLAQGMNTYDAAVSGVYIQGMAGDIAASKIGPAGMIATDVLQAIPETLRELYQI